MSTVDGFPYKKVRFNVFQINILTNFDIIVSMKYRKCSRCEKSKVITQFSWKNKSKQIRHCQCLMCSRLTRRESYIRHKEKTIKKSNERNKIKRKEFQEFMVQYLRTKSCIDCGENNILVLDFDHVKGNKKFDVSNGSLHSRENLLEEISKCEIRCRNCHAIKTHRENNTYKWEIVSGSSTW